MKIQKPFEFFYFQLFVADQNYSHNSLHNNRMSCPNYCYPSYCYLLPNCFLLLHYWVNIANVVGDLPNYKMLDACHLQWPSNISFFYANFRIFALDEQQDEDIVNEVDFYVNSNPTSHYISLTDESSDYSIVDYLFEPNNGLILFRLCHLHCFIAKI